MALTENYLIYCVTLPGETSAVASAINFFSLKSRAMLAGVFEYKHEGAPIHKIFPNKIGTRIVFMDEMAKGYFYRTADNAVMEIDGFAPSTKHVLWDNADRNVFVAADSTQFSTFVFTSVSVDGPKVTKLGDREFGTEQCLNLYRR